VTESELSPDRGQIELFVESLFRHASLEGYVSLRAFYEDSSKSFRITPTALFDGLPFLIEAAQDDATRAANHPKRVVFCPPLATFANKKGATESDLLEGPALSVECDTRPYEARAKLEAILGPATLVVRSGGKWVDPKTGEIQDKLHLHWRLKRPARNEELQTLKRAREVAAGIAGADTSNVPICHPIRWPGSWHRKGEPVLCSIETASPDSEIDLDAALAALLAAAPVGDSRQKANGKDRSAGDGLDWGDHVAGIVGGTDYHKALARLAAKMVSAGMQTAVIMNMLRALMESSTGPHDARWQARYDDIPRAVISAEMKYRQQPNPETPPAENDGAAFGYSWHLTWHGEDDAASSARKWSVLDLLPETGVVLISGQWGTYKTFIADDLSAALMTATPFAHKQVVHKGGVLFLACEGQSEVNIRLTAAFRNRGGTGNAPFAWVPGCPRLLDPNADKILAAMVKHAAVMTQDFGLPVAMVVIDTAGKAAGLSKTGELNDDAIAKSIMRVLAEASTQTGALFVGVAHFGKNVETGTKGSTGFEDDADVVLALLGNRGINGVVTNPVLCVRKRKSGPNGEELPFRAEETGVLNGGLITEKTLTIRWMDAEEEPIARKTKKQNPWAVKSLYLLHQSMTNMLADCGSQQRPYPDGPLVRAVDLNIVRAEFHKSYPAIGDEAAKKEARKKAFNRAIETAHEKRLIGSRDIGAVTYVWLTDGTGQP
jgi:hypothetical protein